MDALLLSRHSIRCCRSRSPSSSKASISLRTSFDRTVGRLVVVGGASAVSLTALKIDAAFFRNVQLWAISRRGGKWVPPPLRPLFRSCFDAMGYFATPPQKQSSAAAAQD